MVKKRKCVKYTILNQDIKNLEMTFQPLGKRFVKICVLQIKNIAMGKFFYKERSMWKCHPILFFACEVKYVGA